MDFEGEVLGFLNFWMSESYKFFSSSLKIEFTSVLKFSDIQKFRTTKTFGFFGLNIYLR